MKRFVHSFAHTRTTPDMAFAFAVGEHSFKLVFWLLVDIAYQDRQKENCKKMATRTHRKTLNIEQTQKVIPLISRGTSFGQNVSELVFWCSHI